MIDIVDIKKADYLVFYVERVNNKNYIYCENTVTNERVVISEMIVQKNSNTGE